MKEDEDFVMIAKRIKTKDPEELYSAQFVLEIFIIVLIRLVIVGQVLHRVIRDSTVQSKWREDKGIFSFRLHASNDGHIITRRGCILLKLNIQTCG